MAMVEANFDTRSARYWNKTLTDGYIVDQTAEQIEIPILLVSLI